MGIHGQASIKVIRLRLTFTTPGVDNSPKVQMSGNPAQANVHYPPGIIALFIISRVKLSKCI